MLLWDTCSQRKKKPIHDWLGDSYCCKNFLLRLRTRKGKCCCRALVKNPIDALETTDPINESFSDELLYMFQVSTPWFTNIVNYLVIRQMPTRWSKQERFFAQLKHYFWKDPELFKVCPDQVIRWCVPVSEFHNILSVTHLRRTFFLSENCNKNVAMWFLLGFTF